MSCPNPNKDSSLSSVNPVLNRQYIELQIKEVDRRLSEINDIVERKEATAQERDSIIRDRKRIAS